MNWPAVLAVLLAAGVALLEPATGTFVPGRVPAFYVSAFKDISAYTLDQTQRNLAGKVNVELKWVKNADEAHSDLRTGKADLASMSYDDTLSMALQENSTTHVAAWPVHGSLMQLCGVINVQTGNVRVGIDTNTGYARMLRQYLRKTLSPADYSQIQWIYAGATNLRYGKLVAGELDSTLLNAPFTAFIATSNSSIPCLPFYTFTGKIQGTVGNILRTQFKNKKKEKVLRTFFRSYRAATLAMRSNPGATKAGLAQYYNVTLPVAEKIYNSLWGVDGIQTSFCFDYDRLANVESIFAADTGIKVPKRRSWVVDWGCKQM